MLSIGLVHYIDFVYFASVPSRNVAPDDGERHTDHWRWFTPADLRETDPGDAHLGPEIVDIGTEAVEAVSGR